MLRDAAWMDLFMEAQKRAHRNQREADDRILAIIAGEPATLFGKPVEFTVRWPEGAPMHKTDEEMRDWCANQLEVSRRLSC